MPTDQTPHVSAFSQMFPPNAVYTEKEVPDLSGKVYIVTGSNTGVGKEVAQILYAKNAAVYVAARTESKALSAIESIKSAVPTSTGKLHYLKLDLGDLTTIKASASEFLARESRLDVLFNNAGVMMPPDGSKTAQGYELQLGTNCLGHFLFTKLLTPILLETAKKAPKGSVRVVWVSSSAADFLSLKNGGIDMGNLNYEKNIWKPWKYGVSKAGNYYHSTEFARKYTKDGVVSIALNPGNLRSELDRHVGNVIGIVVRKLTTYPPIQGAYTEIFAGLSDHVSLENSGDWVVPWGRLSHLRKDLEAGSKPESEGGTGHAEKFWQWSEEQVKPYL